jgi:polyphosphate kinase
MALASEKIQPVLKRYFSRDESWLDFNGRVLEEAQSDANPLLERVKFLAITWRVFCSALKTATTSPGPT